VSRCIVIVTYANAVWSRGLSEVFYIRLTLVVKNSEIVTNCALSRTGDYIEK
jgi:hypothetical protein